MGSNPEGGSVSRRQHQRAKTKEKQAPVVQWVVMAAVIVLVGVVVVLKAQQSDARPTAALSEPVEQVAVSSPAVETSAPPPSPTPALLPEAQLDQLLADGQPVFVFFHSNNCYQCLQMIEVVEQVYPAFAGEVPLVDVNVYDENNRNLLYRAGIRAIPTLIFIDRTGQAQGYVGVMDADALREQLQALAGE
jgi:thiol:disulfide interchange protein